MSATWQNTWRWWYEISAIAHTEFTAAWVLNSGSNLRIWYDVSSKNMKLSCRSFAKAQVMLERFWTEKSSICSSASWEILVKSSLSRWKSFANAHAVLAKFCGLKISGVVSVGSAIFSFAIWATALCSFRFVKIDVAKAQIRFERPWGVKPSMQWMEDSARALKNWP